MTIKANETRFLFSCNKQKKDTFTVDRFLGTDGISVPYRFDITLTSGSADVDGEDLINTQLTLFIRRGDRFYPYSGIVTAFRYIETTVDYSTYRAVVQPQLWRLSCSVQSQIFQKTTVPDIIETAFGRRE